MVSIHFGKRKAVETPVPRPPSNDEQMRELTSRIAALNKQQQAEPEMEKVQVFSWYELQTLQVLNAILEEQVKVREMLEAATKE